MENDFRSYVEEHWEEILADIETLVRIPSVSDPTQAGPGCPFGPDARAALDAVVGIAQRMGFSAYSDDGYVGICDVPGNGAAQLGVIGHVDVVPAGPGWTVDPFALTRKEGCILGRGVTDDKGPVVLALWALRYWADRFGVAQGGRLPHPVRFIFGSSEENGMADVAYYRSKHPDPDFLFTPDAEFPVCNGEKGLFGAYFTSEPIPVEERTVLELECGTVPNAVPGTAYAVVRAAEGTQRFEFNGRSAHASTPELGESAMRKLVDFLLGKGLCSARERRFLEFAAAACDGFHGESFGLQTEDAMFGKLTGVAGTLRLDGDRFELSYDVRFPTTADADEIEATLREFIEPWGTRLHMETVRKEPPFLVNPDSAPVQALLRAFNAETGTDARTFTMGGATYAREFRNACSFGAEMPWVEVPTWLGGMHAPDEGVPEELMKSSLRIYLRAFEELFAVPISDA